MRRFAGGILIGLCMIGAWTGTALSGSYGTELPFVAGAGARASGLGLAGVSLVESPSLMYFNPGVLRRYDYKTFEFYRTTLFDSDAQYLALSYIHPTLDYGTFGVSVLRLGVGGVEQRDINNNLLGEIEDGQTRILLGYGVHAHPLLSVGFNLKIDHHSFAGFSSTGVGFDVGLHTLRKLSEVDLFREVRAGLALENLIEPTITLDQDGVSDPLRATLGASLVAVHREFGFTTALDIVAPRFSPIQLRFGQEVSYNEFFALRFGMQGSTPTFGLGGQYRTLALDYAYRSEDLGSNHRISLTVGFGGSVRERISERSARLDAELQERVTRRVSEQEKTQLANLMTAADSLFEAGDYSGALRQYDVVLLWDPANPHAGQRLAECRYRIEINEGRQSFDENEYVAALYRARLALQIKHGDTEAMALVSKCQLRIEENADRSQMIASVLRSAIDRYADGRYVEAEAGFQEVLRMDPENRLAAEYEYKSRTNVQNAIHRLVLRSRSLAERGQYGSAIASLEEALRLQPNGNIKADLLVLRQRQRDAAASTKASTALRKTRPPSSERTAISKALENRYESGLRHLEKGDFDRAARDLLEVWTVEPRYRNVSDVLTRSYLFMGMKVYSEERYEDAIRIWEKVLAIDPGNAKAQRYLRKTREEAGRLSGGQQ